MVYTHGRNFFRIVFAVLNMQAFSEARAAPEFHFNGYFRSTLGFSKRPEQPKFQAPGAGAKYRIGNENDNAFELKLTSQLGAIPEGPPESQMQIVFLLTAYSEHSTTNEKYTASKFGPTEAKEFYVNFAKVLADGNIWVGRRYYDRKLVYSNNHFWLNSVQGANVAAGVDGLGLGFAELDMTLINYEDEVRNSQTKELSGLLLSRMIDARIKKWKLFETDHELNLWFGWVDRPSQKSLGYAFRQGHGFGFWVDSWFGRSVSNTFVAIMRKGAAVVQGDFNARPVREDYDYDLERSRTLEAINTLTADSEIAGFQVNLGIKGEQRGVELDTPLIQRRRSDQKLWTTAGLSSVFYLGPMLGLLVDLGYDQVNDDAKQAKFAELNEAGEYIKGTEKGEDGYLFKQTFALQLSQGKGFYSRPVMRLFYTNARWAEQYRGLVAPSVYGQRTQGWSGGVQTEVWW